MGQSLARRQHAIYGLYLWDEPDIILYAGSWRVVRLDKRLRQHRAGECRTTAKMAAKQGIDTNALRMRVLAYWMSGAEPSPEGKMIVTLQALGQCQWNHPYAMSTEDGRIGGHNTTAKMTPEQLSRRGRIGGRIGVRKLNQTWGKTAMAHAHRVRVGAIGGRNVSREDHARAGRIGGHKTQELAKTPNGSELFARTGRIGGLKMQAGWGKMPEAHEARIHGGRIASCTRWHSDRPKVDRLCMECTAKKPDD
jgi:general stress protein YciG